MRIAIVGLGLIGGSIGLALKQANWRQAEVVGYVRRPEIGSIALGSGVVDRVEPSLDRTVSDMDMVIIATPVLTIKDIFSQIAPFLSTDTIVTDTASTKAQVMRWAEELLPAGASFVGGHPMAGKETSGIKAAAVNLFQRCTYCLTPTAQTRPEAIQTVTDMATKLGATPLILEAEDHDHLVAGISHLPLLLSAALVAVTSQSPDWDRMSLLAASGYRDVTRLASGDAKVNGDICRTNQVAIISWIDAFERELKRLRELVGEGSHGIEEALAHASEARGKWLQKRYQ